MAHDLPSDCLWKAFWRIYSLAAVDLSIGRSFHRIKSPMTREDASYVLLPYGALLLIAQYVFLILAAATVHTNSPACLPMMFTGAGRGWDAGVCLTEEQVWCRYNGGKHIDCAQADCRAEEIRQTLYFRPRGDPEPPIKSAYPGCSSRDTERIWNHIYAMNGRGGQWAHKGRCGMCVPEGDRREAYLPKCTVEQAACRGLFYVPPRSFAGAVPLTCNLTTTEFTSAFDPLPDRDIANSEAYGCPSDTSMFPYSRIRYPP